MFGIFNFLFGQQDNSQLKEALADNAYLVDVRTPSEFASVSVKGAVNIPVDKISGQLSKLKGKKHIVVFCRSGNRSSQAQQWLFVALGGLFTLMPLFNIGCCGASGCNTTYSTSKAKNTEDITYEEVK